jgi:hypothetical protein
VLSQVYKSIFTSPSSAKNLLDEENDTENLAPAKSQKTSPNNSVRRNVASKLHLNDKVTPRSVAYAAVQVCLCRGILWRLDSSVASSSILTCKRRDLGPQFMADLTTLDYITLLLTSLRIPRGLLQRNVPRSYSSGGLCEFFSASHKYWIKQLPWQQNFPSRSPSSPIQHLSLSQKVQGAARSP